GGSVRLFGGRTYDSFNPYIIKGAPTTAASLHVWESLMEPSLDEGSTHYGLLAEWMERGPEDAWVAFRLREEARFHDGRQVGVADVLKSFELLTTQARPFFASYYANVERAVDEGDRVVRFFFDQTGNRELPHIMGQLAVLPAHYWEARDFRDATLEPPLGSGPYRIGAFDAGRYVELERVPEYWGAELPVRIGANNFDTLRYEFFLDNNAALEAFKKGDLDFRRENSALNWAEKYEFPAVAAGDVLKREVALEGPKAVQGFVFNLRRAKFADRRVREALSLAFDFEFTNKSIFFQQYARPNSYFQGSADLMAGGPPTGAELALLEPFRADLPAELFEKAFAYPQTSGDGRIRGQLRRARNLLRSAGLEIRDGALFTPQGERFTLEFLIASAAQERVIGPFLKNLEVLGVESIVRLIDIPQYVRRLNTYDFDMIVNGWRNSDSPGNEQRDFWSAATAEQEGGRNRGGVAMPVLDALIEKIVFAEDRAALAAACRALDRVLLWEHVSILQLYTPFERVAHWARLQAPDPLPSREIGFPEIWWSAEA
ncbi:MAG: extracellular solute-binding protein, partial [Pseudomonadota bacterium]